jgi:hypothetical protein
LNQFQSNIEGAEQKAGQQAITAQKIIDDSIYAQREGERKRLSGLAEKYELLPSMQEYTSQTGLADTLRDRAASRTSDAIGGALDATVTLAGSLGENAALRKAEKAKLAAEEAARQQRIEAFNRSNDEALLQTELAKPIPIDDADYDFRTGIATLYSDDDVFTPTPVEIDPDEPVDESVYEPVSEPDIADSSPVPSNIDELLRSLETDYDSATGEGPDPSSYVTPIPRRQATEIPIEQQVYGNLQYMAGGKYVGKRGGMTQGEFDHDTNKKAIVDEESGKKEGELTGGEGVLNKKHLAEIVEFIKEEDEDGLLSFLRNLLEEPQFGYDFA